MNMENFDSNAQLMILANSVESYHKEKNACKETCRKIGERTGALEARDAVKDEQISTFKIIFEKIEQKVDNLTWKVAIITGIGFAANFFLMYFSKTGIMK